MESNANHFGEHLMIDGYGGDSEALDNREYILESISELATNLGMRMLMEPQILSAPDNHIKDPGGWSAFVVIAESHISIHTFPKRKFLTADIYTCRNGMDIMYIEEYFKNRFHLQDLEVNFVKRGLKYPQNNI